MPLCILEGAAVLAYICALYCLGMTRVFILSELARALIKTLGTEKFDIRTHWIENSCFWILHSQFDSTECSEQHFS